MTKRRKAGSEVSLGNAFEIVVIALVMSISGRIIGGMDLQGDSFADFFDGFGQALTSSDLHDWNGGVGTGCKELS